MVCFIRPVFLLLLFGVSSLAAGLAEATEPAAFPQVTLSTSGATGAAAVAALGAKLPDVAAFYGKTAEQLRQQLLSNNALRVARDGQLFTVSPRARKQTAASMAAATFSMSPAAANLGMASGGRAAIPLEQTFQLHSKPDAPKTIYLNFVGKTLTPANYFYIEDNGLPTIDVPPFSTDANELLFSDAERRIIQEIWQRVAEDYAPFDVNVTTEAVVQSRITRANADDLVYGTEVLFTRNASEWNNSGAGITEIASFFALNDDSGKPAIVFYDLVQTFANGVAVETLSPVTPDLADSASREIGAALGLFLAGTMSIDDVYPGHGESLVNGWVPMMGDLSGKPLRQFSKGEYANASSLDEFRIPIEKQDDFLVITGRGLPLRADEAGNTAAASAWLPVESRNGRGAASFDGVITSDTDIDVFNLKAGVGTLTAQVNPAAVGPNADLMLRLLNSQGTEIQRSSPLQDLSAWISFNITAAGQYFLEVRGTGEGDPLVTGYSSYGSVGAYALTGSFATPSNAPPSAVMDVTRVIGPTAVTLTFDAGRSGDDGSIMLYRWDFGDGTSLEQTTPGPVQKNYPSGSGGVFYTVSLTVTDDTGLTATTTRSIKPGAAPPTAAFTANVLTGPAPLAVAFNPSGSTSDDGITSFAWNFGDGTTRVNTSAVVESKTYTMAGTYPVSLQIIDGTGRTATANVTIVVTGPVAPVASFTPSHSSGVAPLAVTFNPAASSDDGQIVSYRWDFGGGDVRTTGTAASMSKTFNTPGSHTVSLQVTDDTGLTATASRTITVNAPANGAPVASFTSSPSSGVAPLAVTFNPAASNDDVQIVSYRWDFGGGDVRTTGTAASVSKTFNTPGSHTVSLQVTDNAGLTATASRTITVTAPPPTAAPHVTGIEMKLARGARGRVKGRATVTVVDGSGRPAAGATVIAQWLDPVRGVSSGRTRSTGKVDLTSPSTADTGCLRLNVVAIRVGGRLYPADPPVPAEVCRP